MHTGATIVGILLLPVCRIADFSTANGWDTDVLDVPGAVNGLGQC